MSDDSITDLLSSRARVRRLTAEMGIVGAVADAMLDDPERAVRVLDRAKSARGIRDRTAFAVGMWRNGWGLPLPPAPAPPASEFDEGGPPSLSALEYAWSRFDGRGANPVGDALLHLMAAALAKHGGFRQLQAQMRTWQRFDDNGELL